MYCTIVPRICIPLKLECQTLYVDILKLVLTVEKKSVLANRRSAVLIMAINGVIRRKVVWLKVGTNRAAVIS